ncbi:AMP-binding protein [Photorhabdus viridis]|uniref:AMP-binding protein n=1 Tax=Photorhabdus viridis TaxID=3163327 RepID=UPI003306C0CB
MKIYDNSQLFLSERERLATITQRYFSDYQEFCSIVPVNKQILLPVNTPIEAASFPALIGTTSGTTGTMKAVRTTFKVSKNSASNSEHNLIDRLKKHQVFTCQDVVGNLFTINLFSSLHYSACEIAKYCHASVIPIGDIRLLDKKHFYFLVEIGLSVLFGVPASIIQFIEAMKYFDISLSIKKIVFTGESLRKDQEKYILDILGNDLKIIGLYGLSECGFLGLSTENHDQYILFKEDFFFEYDNKFGLLVTSLDHTASYRLIRYATGDNAKISYRNENLLLTDIRRNIDEFNFMGNVVNCKKITHLIVNKLPDAKIQIELSSDNKSKECLMIRVLSKENDKIDLDSLEEEIRNIPELSEAYSRKRGNVCLIKAEYNDFSLSPRGKHLLIIDNRS